MSAHATNGSIVKVLGQEIEADKIANTTLRAIFASAGESNCIGKLSNRYDEDYPDWGDAHDDWSGDNYDDTYFP